MKKFTLILTLITIILNFCSYGFAQEACTKNKMDSFYLENYKLMQKFIIEDANEMLKVCHKTDPNTLSSFNSRMEAVLTEDPCTSLKGDQEKLIKGNRVNWNSISSECRTWLVTGK